MNGEPQVLIPFHRSEALSITEAAIEANRSVRTMREWCLRHDIGRRIGGQWAVSKVALAMHLDGDRAALKTYLEGDRSSPAIVAYFSRSGVPLPKQKPVSDHQRQDSLPELADLRESVSR
jgi:hypothetical protein